MTQRDDLDPKGLIADSYRIEGIQAADCRVIFLDWVLSGGPASDQGDVIAQLLRRHGADDPGHPMTRILEAALRTPPSAAARRGGRKGRKGCGNVAE